jgi:hypothetical protein
MTPRRAAKRNYGETYEDLRFAATHFLDNVQSAPDFSQWEDGAGLAMHDWTYTHPPSSLLLSRDDTEI